MKTLVKWDDRIPFVLVGVLVGCIVYTLGESQSWEWPHLLHTDAAHQVANHYLMWIFFLYLGVELSVTKILRAGKFVASATLGGMIVPPICCYALTGNAYIAAGAAATDVAFSMGASKLLTKGNKTILVLMATSLLILAVGDDLGGIGIMAVIYANGVERGWLFVEFLVLSFTLFCGEWGVVPFKIQEAGKPETLRHYQWVVEINSVTFWLFLAFLNTFVIYMSGVEWILGGCLAFIMAPPSVNEKVGDFLRPIIPLVLLIFGTVNGAIDLLDPNSFGWVTIGCLVGGMGGKQIGVLLGGLIGRWWCRQSEKDVYANMPFAQIYGLAVLASVNGTVAIFFVAMALSKGYINATESSQATLGFFMTVPAVYLQVLTIKAIGFVKDDPVFQPPR